MAVKSEVLKFLEERRGEPVSGEAAAEALSVSRAAVWKAVAALKKEGYEITAVRKKGYALSPTCDKLSEEGIKAFLGSGKVSGSVKVFDTLDSTNAAAWRAASDGVPHGSVIAADSQTAGRGRSGRRFFSPSGSGIYMSVVLRPRNIRFGSFPFSLAAALAVCDAAERITGARLLVKWPNDIFLRGRKICGILCEALAGCETGLTDAVVAGVGLNVRTEDFPEELSEAAGSLNPENAARNEIAAAIAERLSERMSGSFSARRVTEEYSERFFRRGEEAAYILNGKKLCARAAGFTASGLLILRDEKGRTRSYGASDIRLLPEAAPFA